MEVVVARGLGPGTRSRAGLPTHAGGAAPRLTASMCGARAFLRRRLSLVHDCGSFARKGFRERGTTGQIRSVLLETAGGPREIARSRDGRRRHAPRPRCLAERCRGDALGGARDVLRASAASVVNQIGNIHKAPRESNARKTTGREPRGATHSLDLLLEKVARGLARRAGGSRCSRACSGSGTTMARPGGVATEGRGGNLDPRAGGLAGEGTRTTPHRVSTRPWVNETEAAAVTRLFRSASRSATALSRVDVFGTGMPVRKRARGRGRREEREREREREAPRERLTDLRGARWACRRSGGPRTVRRACGSRRWRAAATGVRRRTIYAQRRRGDALAPRAGRAAACPTTKTPCRLSLSRRAAVEAAHHEIASGRRGAIAFVWPASDAYARVA